LPAIQFRIAETSAMMAVQKVEDFLTSHQLVAAWLLDAYGSIPVQTVKNAWMKTGYEWF
jgi:hypothetical protein